MEKLIIVGSGPAGLTAALYASRARLNPLVIEGLQPGGQLTTTTLVENYPGFVDPVDGTALVEQMKKQAERFGTRYLSETVQSADFHGQPLKLVLEGGRILESAAIIIATGASAKYLGLGSEEKLRGRGVSACATCDGALYRNVPVAIVGGGDTAMEEALFLTRFASGVTLLHRRDHFRASKIMADRVLANPKIEILWNTAVDEVLDVWRNEVTGLRVRDVNTGAKSEIPAAALFVAIGHQPNTAPFVGQIDMSPDGYVAVTSQRTSVKGVFAAGDVHDRTYRQAVTAAGTGCAAALEAERYLESIGQ